MQPRRGRGGGDRPAVRKGPWTPGEDEVLLQHVREHGPREWSSIQSKGLLPRTGKSCRLRWVNKLRPDIKKGCKFSPEEERLVLELQAQIGNKWATIATHLTGRTDNDVKNFWSTRQKRLARLSRAPLPRRRTGKQNCSTSSAPSLEMPDQKPLCLDPCMGSMIQFQGTMHHVGQSSSQVEPCADMEPFHQETKLHISQSSRQEPRAANNQRAADTPSFPGRLSPTPRVEVPMHATVEGSECPVHELELMVPAPFLGMDDEYWDVFCARHQDMSGLRFDDLTPDTLEFFDRPLSPPS